MQSYTDWVAQAQRGTSGDMVWDILSDWEKDIKQARTEERKKLGEWLYARKVPSGDNWYMSASPVYDTATVEITKGELETLRRGEDVTQV